MDILHAPWRMDLIESGGGAEAGCLFCRVAKAPPSPATLLIRTTAHCLVMLNRYPYNSGHLMVAPLKHTASLSDLGAAEALDLFGQIARATEVLTAAMSPQGFNVGLNLGLAGGAGIADHLHVHVVPRWPGDTNFMPVLAATKVLPEHLARTHERLSELFSAD